MMAADLKKQRANVARLVDTLAPLIEAHLREEPKPEPAIRYIHRKVMVPADKATLDAAAKVAQAVDLLDQTKYVGGREVAARQALERAARSLRTQLKNREAKRGGK